MSGVNILDVEEGMPVKVIYSRGPNSTAYLNDMYVHIYEGNFTPEDDEKNEKPERIVAHKYHSSDKNTKYVTVWNILLKDSMIQKKYTKNEEDKIVEEYYKEWKLEDIEAL